MPVPLAEPQDVAGIWRPLTEPELVIAIGQLRFASAIVRQQIPSVDSRMLNGTLDADLVRGVVASMVQRVLMNPERNSEVAIDDMRMKKSESIASGNLYLSPDEFALLRPPVAVGGSTAGAFTIRFGGTPDAPHGTWRPL